MSVLGPTDEMEVSSIGGILPIVLSSLNKISVNYDQSELHVFLYKVAQGFLTYKNDININSIICLHTSILYLSLLCSCCLFFFY